MDFARDGFGRLTAAGAEQAGTNAVGLDFYNHISFPRRVYGYEGRDPVARDNQDENAATIKMRMPRRPALL